MSSPRYRYAHQQEKEAWRPTVDAGDAYCAETICLYPSRWIPPGTPWDLCHDTTGTITLGPGHAKCNRSEAAKRGNRMRRRTPSVQAPTAGRWEL